MLAINLHQNFHWQQPETADGYTEDEAGIVRNGVIILDNGCALPDGTRVRVSVIESTEKAPKHRITFPLVPSENPGSLHLTNEMIGQILDEEDATEIELS